MVVYKFDTLFAYLTLPQGMKRIMTNGIIWIIIAPRQYFTKLDIGYSIRNKKCEKNSLNILFIIFAIEKEEIYKRKKKKKIKEELKLILFYNKVIILIIIIINLII